MGAELTDVGRAALAGDPSWNLVLRVSASASFQKSPRLQQLLLYICERALLNRPDDLREQLIGCRVFLRQPHYSPGDDNIVRVEVRRLRKRLDEYFATEGLDEPIVITIPKGSYVPVFHPRGQTADSDSPAPATPELISPPAAGIQGSPPQAAAPSSPKRSYRLAVIVAIAAVLVGSGVWALAGAKMIREATAPSSGRSPLWPALFNHDEETLIVCADATLVMAQALMRRSVSFDDYVKRDYRAAAGQLDAEARRVLGLMPGWTWTDLADVRLVDRLHRANTGFWDRTTIRTARTAQIHDFTSGNAVILGSSQSNPWNALFEKRLNFRIEWDEQTRTALVRNKSPRPGELPVYGNGSSDNSVVYSTIAFIPNLRHDGNVLIVAGTTGQGTETAGEYITNSVTNSRLMRMVESRNGGELPYFEVLLKSGTLAGVAQGAEVIAFRTYSPGPKSR